MCGVALEEGWSVVCVRLARGALRDRSVPRTMRANRPQARPRRRQAETTAVPLQRHPWEWRAGSRATRNAFSEQTNCFSSPSARGTESFLDRRKPPRKCRLKECSPGTTWYTLICLGEMAPIFEPSTKTLTTPPSPIAELRRCPRLRPSLDAARTTTRVGNVGQIRFGARHSWMVAPPLVAATTSDLSRSSLIVLSYTDRRKKNSRRLIKSRLGKLGNRGRPSTNTIEQSIPERQRAPPTTGSGEEWLTGHEGSSLLIGR